MDVPRAPTADELGLLIREVGRASLLLHHALAEGTRMTPQDMAALTHLVTAGPLTPNQLRELMRLRSSSITAVLDRLEARGHVERGPHPGDGRSRVVSITDSGRQAAFVLLRPVVEGMRDLGEVRTPEERELIAGYLRDATRLLTAAAEAIPTRD